MALRAPDGERTGPVEALALILVALLGSYAIANAVYPMAEYLSTTFELAETRAGAWWFVRATIAEAPLLILFLVGIATVATARNRGLIASCALTTALLQGMAVALFGIPSEFVELVEPSLPTGLLTALVGWALGTGLSLAIDDFPDEPTAVVVGNRNGREDLAELAGGAFFLFFGGYAVVRGVQMMTAYLDRVIGQPDGGVLFFLELYLFDAPLVLLFLLGVAIANATREGRILTRGGVLLVSCALPTALLLGMGFAEFGFPPKLRNVFYQAIPAGIAVGALGWLLGVGAMRVRHSTRFAGTTSPE